MRLAHQRVQKARSRRGARRAELREHRSPERHEGRLLPKRSVQRRDVAEADERLGISGDQLVVEQSQELYARMAAAEADDRIDGRIRESGLDVSSRSSGAPAAYPATRLKLRMKRTVKPKLSNQRLAAATGARPHRDRPPPSLVVTGEVCGRSLRRGNSRAPVRGIRHDRRPHPGARAPRAGSSANRGRARQAVRVSRESRASQAARRRAARR